MAPTILTDLTVTGLKQVQRGKLLKSIARQINIPLNGDRLKIGVIEDFLVGLDDAGRFIAARGTKMNNGDYATVSRFGVLDKGGYSKVISENAGKTERGFFAELAEQLKLSFDMNRTKTGTFQGNPIAIEYDTGRFITATKEQLKSGEIGVTGLTGKIEGTASKIVPQKDLMAMKITKRT